MPRAALTPAAPSDQAAVRPRPPAASNRRGNPNLGLAPRCGVRTRAGCSCASPEIHGKLSCRMHGGRSPGPRTPEGLPPPRLGAASEYATPAPSMASTASTRADNRHRLTPLRIVRHARTPHLPGFECLRWPSFVCRLRLRNREPAANPGSTVPFKPSRIDPLNREPTARPATTPYKPFRTDPLNREPTAKPGSTALPARAQDPAPRPGQSGEGSNIRGVALDLASFTRLPCRPATRFSPRPRHRATLPGLAVLPGGNHNGRTRRAAPARPHHY
jgi:hypothetical protein